MEAVLPSLASERFSSQALTPPWIRLEHQARYEFAQGFVAGREVVDCACGDGAGSRMFARAAARRVRAFDVSRSAIEKNAGTPRPENLQFDVASATALPVSERDVDVYVSLETIEHLDDDRSFLEEAVRVLRPEGIFICSTPNRRVTNPGRTLGDRPWNRFHIREYDEGEFGDLLRQYFESVELFGQNPVRPSRVRVMGVVGRLPGHAAVWINQALKLPRFIRDRSKRYRVQSLPAGGVPEYMVAVCRRPRPARA